MLVKVACKRYYRVYDIHSSQLQVPQCSDITADADSIVTVAHESSRCRVVGLMPCVLFLGLCLLAEPHRARGNKSSEQRILVVLPFLVGCCKLILDKYFSGKRMRQQLTTVSVWDAHGLFEHRLSTEMGSVGSQRSQ